MSTTRKLAFFVVPVVAAMALTAAVASESGSSIHQKAATKSSSRPLTKPVSMPAGKSPITISITSKIRHGNLVVLVDDQPVFNEEFEKPIYLLFQTITWDPLAIPTGKHRLTAKVYSASGKTYLSGVYDLDVRKNGMGLRVKMKGDKLTVEPAS